MRTDSVFLLSLSFPSSEEHAEKVQVCVFVSLCNIVQEKFLVTEHGKKRPPTN